MRGPIDYIIVGFEGNKFDGSILEALVDSMEQGIIDLISLAVVLKDQDGSIAMVDINEMDDDYDVHVLLEIAGDLKPVEEDDIREMTDLLENNTAAGILIIEQLWAIPLKQAITKANGVLVAEGRIHPEAARELTKP